MRILVDCLFKTCCMTRLLCLLTLILTLSTAVLSQIPETIDPALSDPGMADRLPYEITKQIDDGVSLMERGEFARADFYFRQALETVKRVPADLCFYFGKNSYHLHKYKQSIDWLGKYLEIKGTTGRFFDQATEYLKLAESDYLAQLEKGSSKVNQSADNAPAAKEKALNCEEHPYVVCPICNGSGVIVSSGKLGALVYKTCPYSDESGRMRCEDFLLYQTGQLVSE